MASAVSAVLSCLSVTLAAGEIQWPPASGRKLQVPTSVCTSSYPITNCNDPAQNISEEYGLCVTTGGANGIPVAYQCWDVCDPTHADSSEYKVVGVGEFGTGEYADQLAEGNNTEIAMLVNRIRHGKNLQVKCAQNFNDVSDWCVPGHTCGGPSSLQTFGKGTTAHAKSIPEGRGMCVVDPSGPYGRACWDMCNYNLLPEAYAKTPAVKERVDSFRSGGSCPHVNVWPWILGFLIVLCVAAGVGTLVMKGYLGGKFSRRTRGVNRSMDFDPALESPDVRDAQIESQMEEAELNMPPDFQPEHSQRDYVMPPVPQTSTQWHGGKIPGLDEPHLFQQQPMLSQTTPQAYLGAPVMTQPTPLSQPPILQTTLPMAFATQAPPGSQPGSMRLPAHSGQMYYSAMR